MICTIILKRGCVNFSAQIGIILWSLYQSIAHLSTLAAKRLHPPYPALFALAEWAHPSCWLPSGPGARSGVQCNRATCHPPPPPPIPFRLLRGDSAAVCALQDYNCHSSPLTQFREVWEVNRCFFFIAPYEEHISLCPCKTWWEVLWWVGQLGCSVGGGAKHCTANP